MLASGPFPPREQARNRKAKIRNLRFNRSSLIPPLGIDRDLSVRDRATLGRHDRTDVERGGPIPCVRDPPWSSRPRQRFSAKDVLHVYVLLLQRDRREVVGDTSMFVFSWAGPRAPGLERGGSWVRPELQVTSQQ